MQVLSSICPRNLRGLEGEDYSKLWALSLVSIDQKMCWDFSNDNPCPDDLVLKLKRESTGHVNIMQQTGANKTL